LQIRFAAIVLPQFVCRSSFTVDTPITRPASNETAHYKLSARRKGLEMCAALLIRPAGRADLPSITAIYAWNVLNGTGTFELEPPDEEEMVRRHEDVVSKGLPWLVAQRGDAILGYAYANHFRPRKAYRFCVEDSVYLAGDAKGQGLGRLLLAELMARCEAVGARQMLAVIGDSQNLGSVGVHRTLGFEHVGVMKAAGWKFNRWLDVVIMQKALGLGATANPVDAA
jgi:L-amino acid N-acyltransferase YncA